MPQPTNHTNKKKKATSNGRIPAYQNTFAFQHNPKSKKTAAILAAPIYHCCGRCRDKLTWRKQYRKYKPLTQPAVCNLCQKRNIKAAYHTVCESCSRSHAQAVALLRQWNEQDDAVAPNTTASVQEICPDVGTGVAEEVATSSNTTNRLKREDHEAAPHRYTRVCAVCFKQPALTDEDGNSNGHEASSLLDQSDKPLKLRQIKTLQRRQNEQKASSKKSRNNHSSADRNTAMETEDGSHSSDDDESECFSEDDMNEEASEEEPRTQSRPVAAAAATEDILAEDKDDPFLMAIGGVQNLLVGEAYQAKRLREKEQSHENAM